MKDFNEYTVEQMEYFMDWIQSDNVVYYRDEDYIGNSSYETQCTQYRSRFSYGEILMYWWKEYGQYIEWEEEEEEIENEFRR